MLEESGLTRYVDPALLHAEILQAAELSPDEMEEAAQAILDRTGSFKTAPHSPVSPASTSDTGDTMDMQQLQEGFLQKGAQGSPESSRAAQMSVAQRKESVAQRKESAHGKVSVEGHAQPGRVASLRRGRSANKSVKRALEEALDSIESPRV